MSLECAVALVRMTASKVVAQPCWATVPPLDHTVPATEPPEPVSSAWHAFETPEDRAPAFLGDGGTATQRALSREYGISRPLAAKLLAEASSKGRGPQPER